MKTTEHLPEMASAFERFVGEPIESVEFDGEAKIIIRFKGDRRFISVWAVGGIGGKPGDAYLESYCEYGKSKEL